ncbi:hypothetical protein GCM10012275_42380 [Longimycelium tulufanense]|uniref:Uncharacterized protein n=1 Tax=Longimycelium tulufanense TaxID=907463 RepID=A0A8J3FWL1_9PSEU|nr:hypothetical protein GCM10012275_42380 [Longimycelium tulufanense]
MLPSTWEGPTPPPPAYGDRNAVWIWYVTEVLPRIRAIPEGPRRFNDPKWTEYLNRQLRTQTSPANTMGA